MRDTVGDEHTTKVTSPDDTPLRKVWNPPVLMAPEPTMLITTCCTADASVTWSVSDDAELRSATLTVKASDELLLEGAVRVMAPLETVAAVPPAEQSDEA